MKTKLLTFATIFLLVLSINSYAQISITSYSIYALGISTSQNKAISGELKTFANSSVTNLWLEADVFYNFKPKPYHRFSIGLGVKTEPFVGFDQFRALTIPAQLEIFPLQDFKKVSIMFEIAPEFIDQDDVYVRSLWGIRYSFGEP